MRGHLLPVASVLSVAVSARLLQLLLSSLPLNIDSFAQVAIATDLMQSGHWGLDEESLNAYNLKMPHLPVLLAVSASLTGVDPLRLAAPFMIIISLSGILGTYALAYVLTRKRAIAASAALVLALLGPYIFLSSTLMKEAVGLSLLPLLVLLLMKREDRRMRGLAAAILLILPLIHHLSMVMAYGFVSLIVLLQHAQAYWHGRWSWRALGLDLLLGPALFLFGLWYYISVRMEFFTTVWSTNEIALFLSTALIMAAAGLLLTSRRRARPWFALSKSKLLPSLVDQKSLVIVGAFLLVVANAYRPLFPGTVRTSYLLLAIAAVYIPLTLLALVGFNVHRLSSGPQKTVVLSLILAPLTVIVYALLRGLDPLSHVLLYRSVDFLDYGLAIAIGTALLRRPRGRRRSVLVIVMLLSLLATLPLAYGTEEVLQVQNTTYRYELAALGWLVGVTGVTPETDQRIGAILSMYFNARADSTLPFKLEVGAAHEAGSVLLVEENWSTRGAQVHPLPFLRIREEAFLRLQEDSNLIYHGGDSVNSLYIIIATG